MIQISNKHTYIGKRAYKWLKQSTLKRIELPFGFYIVFF